MSTSSYGPTLARESRLMFTESSRMLLLYAEADESESSSRSLLKDMDCREGAAGRHTSKHGWGDYKTSALVAYNLSAALQV